MRKLAPLSKMKTISRRPALQKHEARLSTALRPVLLGAAFCAAMSATMPALAQWYDRPPGFNTPPELYGDRPQPVFRGNARPLPPDEFVERLEEDGYEDVSRPRYNGSTYEIDATSRRGRRVRIVFDAFRGNVVERFALGGATGEPFAGRPSEPRGWFGNNVRPPEEAPQPRRYGRPADEDDGPDTFERLSRPAEPRLSRPADPRLAPPGRVDVGPPIGAPSAPPAVASRAEPNPGSPSIGPQAPQTPSRPRDIPAPERQAARPETAAPEAGGNPGRVEGVNPSPARPATRAPQNERAGKPESNRQFEANRTEPAQRKPAAKPPVEGPAAAISPAAPGIAVEAPTAPSAEKPAVSAETTRSDKPVRVIGGVTPMNPDGSEPKAP